MPSSQLISNPLIPSTLSGILSTATADSQFQDYQINLSAFSSSTASISLTNLTGDANLQVYQGATATGTAIAQSQNGGSLSESLLLGNQTPLAAGTYTIRVSLGSNAISANYNLNVAVNANAALSNILWTNGTQAGIWQMSGTTRSVVPDNTNISGWKVQGTADLNGDGEDDILWRNTTDGTVGYWLMQGGKRVAAGLTSPNPVSQDWQIAAVKDLNGDGQAEIIWQNAKAGQSGIWKLASGKLVSPAGFSTAGWTPLTATDLNGDGRNDIVWQNSSTGDVGFWQMKDDGVSYSAANSYSPGIAWKPQFYGDVNGDGQSDIILRNSTTGAIAIWMMNGVNRLPTSWMTGAISTDWQISALGSFGGNPKREDGLVWTNSKTGEVGLWQFDTTGTKFVYQGYITSGGTPLNRGTGWTIAGVSDLNYDGKDDIVYRNAQQQIASVMLMNGSTVSASQDFTGIDASWTVPGIMKRQVTADPFDISGRTATDGFNSITAFDLGLMNGSGKYTNTVTSGASDYFKFNVSVGSNVTLRFDTPVAGASLDLFSIQSDGTLGTKIQISNEQLLTAGSYAVKVSTTNLNDLSYTLSVSGKPQMTDVAGASFSVSSPSFALNPTGTKNTVTATFQIVNNGSTTLNSVDVDFLLSRDGQINPALSTEAVLNLTTSGSTIYTLATPIAPGATSAPIQVQLDLPDTSSSFWYVDGTYTLGMVVDPNNRLTETNERNNYNVALGTDKSSLGITGTQTLQLIGTNMTLNSGTLTPTTDTSKPKTIDVSFTVTNIGNKAFPLNASLPLQFYLSPDPTITQSDDAALQIMTVNGSAYSSPIFAAFTYSYDNPALAKGQSITLDFTLALPTTSKWNWGTGTTFYVASWIDPTNSLGSNSPVADVTKETIDPTTVGTATDTIGKNYLKLTKS